MNFDVYFHVLTLLSRLFNEVRMIREEFLFYSESVQLNTEPFLLNNDCLDQ